MGRIRPRTEAQQDFIIEQRLRAIETGEWLEKLELHQLNGWHPPIGGFFKAGESEGKLEQRMESHQETALRAARAGIYLPGPTSQTHQAIIEAKRLERQGVVMQAVTKDRFSMSQALDGFSGWEVPDLVDYDFAYLNLAAATTYNGAVLGVFPATNAPLIGSPDPLDPATTAATASRVTGSGSKKYLTVLSAWIFSRSSAGAVYTAAAGTTLQPFVCSAGSAATQLFTALSAAATNVNALAAFWTQIALTAPADRVIQKFAGTGAQAGILAAFWSDFLMAQLITTGALNIQGNTLTLEYELA